jgi:hypothetical protein
LGGKWPKTPFLFLPQVQSFPSTVIPAEIDFLASISTNLTFFTSCGNDMFDYDPNPSSPFRPNPHDHTYAYLR